MAFAAHPMKLRLSLSRIPIAEKEPTWSLNCLKYLIIQVTIFVISPQAIFYTSSPSFKSDDCLYPIHLKGWSCVSLPAHLRRKHVAPFCFVPAAVHAPTCGMHRGFLQGKRTVNSLCSNGKAN